MTAPTVEAPKGSPLTLTEFFEAYTATFDGPEPGAQMRAAMFPDAKDTSALTDEQRGQLWKELVA